MLILSFCLLGLRWFVRSQSQSLSSLLTVGREYCVNRKTHQDVSQLIDITSTTNTIPWFQEPVFFPPYLNRKTHQDVSHLIDVSGTTSYSHIPNSENLSYILLKRISEKNCALVEMSTIKLRNETCQQFSIRAARQSVTGN